MMLPRPLDRSSHLREVGASNIQTVKFCRAGIVTEAVRTSTIASGARMHLYGSGIDCSAAENRLCRISGYTKLAFSSAELQSYLYSIAVSECGAAREEIFAFRYVAMQIFDPPLRPVSQSFRPSLRKFVLSGVCTLRILHSNATPTDTPADRTCNSPDALRRDRKICAISERAKRGRAGRHDPQTGRHPATTMRRTAGIKNNIGTRVERREKGSDPVPPYQPCVQGERRTFFSGHMLHDFITRSLLALKQLGRSQAQHPIAATPPQNLAAVESLPESQESCEELFFLAAWSPIRKKSRGPARFYLAAAFPIGTKWLGALFTYVRHSVLPRHSYRPMITTHERANPQTRVWLASGASRGRFRRPLSHRR